MDEYIEREALINFANNHKGSAIDANDIARFPAADVVEVRHGRWHIMPENLYDESECPTEEGWYRIITTDGEEMTDYYFNKPTIIGRGVVYWKNCKKGIRAWAKMDGKGEGE